MASADCIDTPQVTAKEPPWAVLTIPNKKGWKPVNERSRPHGEIRSLPAQLVIQFAVLYNASEYSRQRRTWAVVVEGDLMILTDIPPEERPTDPTAFPPGARLIEDSSADLVAIAENTPRFEAAILPREWTIPLRPLVWIESKGGQRG